MTLIYKIVHADEWQRAVPAGSYDGSAKDREDGFLHLSRGHQLAETLRLYYAGQEDLVLLAVAAEELGPKLKFEYAPSRREDFPHLYGPLPVAAVQWARPIARRDDGSAILPF